jgi:hypothetical protein
VFVVLMMTVAVEEVVDGDTADECFVSDLCLMITFCYVMRCGDTMLLDCGS